MWCEGEKTADYRLQTTDWEVRMRGDAIERAIDGAAATPLTSAQRQRLAMAGRRVWQLCREAGQTAETFEAWRRREALLAVERAGLRACLQADYAPLLAHFALLEAAACVELRRGREAKAAGERNQALRVKAAVEPRRVALWRLAAECEAARDVIEQPQTYVASIARARFKTADLGELSERQVWILVFDLRRNAFRRRAGRLVRKGGVR
jgi:hypothetical protein